jgi:hypothetical protein
MQTSFVFCETRGEGDCLEVRNLGSGSGLGQGAYFAKNMDNFSASLRLVGIEFFASLPNETNILILLPFCFQFFVSRRISEVRMMAKTACTRTCQSSFKLNNIRVLCELNL